MGVGVDVVDGRLGAQAVEGSRPWKRELASHGLERHRSSLLNPAFGDELAFEPGATLVEEGTHGALGRLHDFGDLGD